MNQNSGGLTCAIGCLLIAGLGGAMVAAMLWFLADYAIIAAIFFGGIAAILAFFFLNWAFCRGLPAVNEATVETPSVQAEPVKAAAAPAASAPVATSTPASLVSDVPDAKPAPKAAAAPAAKKPAAKKPAAKKPAAKKPAAKKAPAKAATEKPAAKPAAKKAAKPVAKDGKPPMLKKARAGGADDLKLIKGVGPKLEGTLNELGFWHFDQIAGWRKKEVEWVDERLKFKGRIDRDEWIKQAKTLAKGGSTEFAKRVKKGDVY